MFHVKHRLLHDCPWQLSYGANEHGRTAMRAPYAAACASLLYSPFGAMENVSRETSALHGGFRSNFDLLSAGRRPHGHLARPCRVTHPAPPSLALFSAQLAESWRTFHVKHQAGSHSFHVPYGHSRTRRIGSP